MKIMAATTKGGLDDIVSPVFGRCATFTIVDAAGEEMKEVKVVENLHAGGMGGVGIHVAQLAVAENIEAVMAGRFGPNASEVLSRAGISMVAVSGIAVRDAVRQYLNGRLSPASAGGNSADGPPDPAGAPPGRGWGGGQGRGRGMGRAGGFGRGGGMGRGRGRCCWGTPFAPGTGPSVPDSASSISSGRPFSREEELNMLNAEKEALEARLEEIKKRAEELRK